MITRRQVAGIILAAAVLLAGPAGSLFADWGKTQITVSCYAGDRGDNQYLGTVDIFDTTRAASNCNVMYNGCNGSCTACNADEASREICVDNTGIPSYY